MNTSTIVQELWNYCLKAAYCEFAECVGEIKVPRGSKTDLIVAAINKFTGEFTLAQLERACPDISRI